MAVQQFVLQRQMPCAEQDQRRRRGRERQRVRTHGQQHREPAAVEGHDQQPGRPFRAGSETCAERGDRARVVDVEIFGHGAEAQRPRSRLRAMARPGGRMK